MKAPLLSSSAKGDFMIFFSTAFLSALPYNTLPTTFGGIHAYVLKQPAEQPFFVFFFLFFRRAEASAECEPGTHDWEVAPPVARHSRSALSSTCLKDAKKKKKMIKSRLFCRLVLGFPHDAKKPKIRTSTLIFAKFETHYFSRTRRGTINTILFSMELRI